MAQGRKSHGMQYLFRRPDQPGGVYYVYFVQDGRRIRKSLETSVLAEAKRRRDTLMIDRDRLLWSAESDTSPDVFWQGFEEWAAPRRAKTTLAVYHQHWKSFVDYLKPETLGQVTPALIEKYIRHRRKEGLANTSINDALKTLKALFNRAAELGLYSGANPFAKTKPLPLEKKPPRFLTAEQIADVLDAAKSHGKDIHLFCALAVYAGLRAKEAAHARWEWFDLEQGTLTVQGAEDGSFGTKGKRYRTIPLHAKLKEILEPIRQADGYLINPSKTEPGKWRVRYESKRAFAFVMKVAKVEWCTPHVLRHTFASQLVQAGVSLYKVSQWLGHSDTRTTQIYAHLAPVDDDINRF